MAVLDLLAFPIIGFAISYLALEGEWHFAVYRINNPNLAPCVFKQAKMLIAQAAARMAKVTFQVKTDWNIVVMDLKSHHQLAKIFRYRRSDD
jgi:hypothetical protein